MKLYKSRQACNLGPAHLNLHEARKVDIVIFRHSLYGIINFADKFGVSLDVYLRCTDVCRAVQKQWWTEVEHQKEVREKNTWKNCCRK
ncbi:hypothetical protein CA54_61650 [Symmachiella macrocystis]|uniref:Uncharacterized protein n=1 Tax=Symmachiella macrocystis TaxID=2527985 RepID=A0A5C6AUG1_9PLAN|nr:hypothetical protein CA54_61650 [Symmachiella macrocystis]